MSEWRDQRNATSRVRLEKALPKVFPASVLVHALGRSLIPPLPRLAVESYWAAHPVRADRLTRALAALSEAPPDWAWRLSSQPADGLPRSFRTPPAPFREAEWNRGAGHCCICGQPVFRFGWHKDLWRDGAVNRRATWHGCCVAAWKLWIAPHRHGRVLSRLQARKCRDTGKRLLKTAEVDHRVPLFQVWRQRRDQAWPDVLAHWGFPNLQAINRSAHASKSAAEAGVRAGSMSRTPMSGLAAAGASSPEL